MTHYDIVEWEFFKEDLLDEKIKMEMENHLLECDFCMEVFLGLIDRELETEIENIPELSKDFTEEVLNKIHIQVKTQVEIEEIQIQEKTNKTKKKNKYNEFLVYYLAVASVAIFLMGSGFFTQIVSQSPEFGEKLIASKKEVRVDSLYNLSKNITDVTSSFVKDFNLEIKEKR